MADGPAGPLEHDQAEVGPETSKPRVGRAMRIHVTSCFYAQRDGLETPWPGPPGHLDRDQAGPGSRDLDPVCRARRENGRKFVFMCTTGRAGDTLARSSSITGFGQVGRTLGTDDPRDMGIFL